MSKQDNLYLVGLMGAGKTTVGRLLARHYGCTFHDSDHEIEARTGVKIPVIFEIEAISASLVNGPVARMVIPSGISMISS